MALKTLTAANSVIALAITGLFNQPQQLQGFDVDDVFDSEPVPSAIVKMGVDGRMSGGFIFKEKKISVYLQADSPSLDMFEQWAATQEAQRELLYANGVVTKPSIGKSYTLTKGALTSYPPIGAIKQVLQPLKYDITFESISPAST